MYRISNLALGEGTPAPKKTVIEVWGELNTLCQQWWTPEQCTGLLGTQPFYLPPTCKEEKKGVPWWGYMAIGFVIAKNI